MLLRIVVALLCLGVLLPAQAQPASDPVAAVETLLFGPSDEATLQAFAQAHLSAAYRETMTDAVLQVHLLSLQDAVAEAGALDVEQVGDALHLVFSDGAEATVVVRMSDQEPERLSALHLLREVGPREVSRPAVVRQRIRALEGLAYASTPDAYAEMAATHLTPDLNRSLGADRDSLLALIGRASATSGSISVEPGDPVRLSLRGGLNLDVLFSVEDEAPFRVETLTLETGMETADDGVSLAPITWDTVADRLAEEADEGFAGTVLLVRDGEVVHHQGYGYANEDTGRLNDTTTMYGIGSTPIDFTRGAILHLWDRGLLDLDDPVARFFDAVPDDKASLTVRHLMTGRSGLPNFHHDPSVDADYDLSWISRDEAVDRILSAPLLFPPGTDEAHSHSAFVLLAAVVEVVTEQPFARYLRSTFFEPLGMTQTGFYGADVALDPDKQAVGYGGQSIAPVNKPWHWGPTSWLVMGSGGMVSTPADLHRWLQAVHESDLLSEQSRSVYGRGQTYAGTSDRGVLNLFVDDPEWTAIVCSNQHREEGDRVAQVAQALATMVRDSRSD